MARVLSIANDLMLASRVDAGLTAAGHHVILAASLAQAPLDEAELIVADLEVESPEALVAVGVPVLGYYSHVDAETRRVAVAAGVDLVVPRSRMARELPDLVQGLLQGRGGEPPPGRLRLSVRPGVTRPGRRELAAVRMRR